jgi:hypothetical protein
VILQDGKTKFHVTLISHGTYLVSASRGSRLVSSLWVGGTLLGLITLKHHLGEVDFSADRVFVPALTRVVSRRIRTVSSPGLERVEVIGGARGVWVPGCVHILLGVVVPHLSVESTVATKWTSKETKVRHSDRIYLHFRPKNIIKTYFSSTKRLVAVRTPKGAGAKAEAEATRAKTVISLYCRLRGISG